jgi:hypothetical protein
VVQLIVYANTVVQLLKLRHYSHNSYSSTRYINSCHSLTASIRFISNRVVCTLLHVHLHQIVHYYSTGFAVGILPFADYEDSGQGVTADTVSTSNKYNITMAQVLGMFIFDIIFYSFLAWYAGQVVKSEWGTSKPWYFLVTKVYMAATYCTWNFATLTDITVCLMLYAR